MTSFNFQRFPSIAIAFVFLLFPSKLIVVSAFGQLACLDRNPDHIHIAHVCHLHDESGVLDLSPLVELTALRPLRYAANLTNNVQYAFFYSLSTTGVAACDNGNYIGCQYDLIPNGTLVAKTLGRLSTVSFVRRMPPRNWRYGAADGPMLALQADNSDANWLPPVRSVAFLKCDPNASAISFKVHGFDGEDDYDKSPLYFMEFSSKYFCPKPYEVDNSACSIDYRRGSCSCTLTNYQGVVNLTELQVSTGQMPLTYQDSIYTWTYTFCNALLWSPTEPCNNQMAGACLGLTGSVDSSINLGETSSYRFEFRTSPNFTKPKLALVSDHTRILDPDLGTFNTSRLVAFLNCDKNQPHISYEFYERKSEVDRDGASLFFANFTGIQFCPKAATEPPSACTADYRTGSCVCQLASGFGTLNLSKLQNETMKLPLSFYDNSTNYQYAYTFCGTVSRTGQTQCDNKAAACMWQPNQSPDQGMDIGSPDSVRFELRSSPTRTGSSVAMVFVIEVLGSDVGSGFVMRTVAFLNCDPLRVTVKLEVSEDLGKDFDGAYITYMEMYHRDFCPRSAICAEPYAFGSCTCELRNGSGTIDLSVLTQFTTSNPTHGDGTDGHGYDLTYCGMNMGNANFDQCYGKASMCQTSDYDKYYNFLIAEPQFSRFEMRNLTRQSSQQQLALVIESPLTHSRSISFLICDYGITTFPVLTPRSDVEWDVDNYMIYYSELRGAFICPHLPDPKPACTDDFVWGNCNCTLADGSGIIDLTSLYETTLFAVDHDSNQTFYDATFCNVLTVDPNQADCYNKASVCHYDQKGSSHNIGVPSKTRFEWRLTKTNPVPQLALVTENPKFESDYRWRSVIFLKCDGTLAAPLLTALWSGDVDYDSFKLFYFELRGAVACIQPIPPPPPRSVCNEDFIQGSCTCILADGSGYLDLTELEILTKFQPFSGTDIFYSYDFSLCNTLRNDPTLTQCYRKSSVCGHDFSHNYSIGLPQTTRFEYRSFLNVGGITLVTDDPESKMRSVVLLTCAPSQSTPTFLPYDLTNDRDPDGFKLYYAELTGSQLCLKYPPAVPACKETSKPGSCVCDFADGSGKLDLTALTLKPQPYTTMYNSQNYTFAFCRAIENPKLLQCDGQAASCQSSNRWDSSSNLGRPTTMRFEMRRSADHNNSSLALVADASGVDGINRRTVAFLHCLENAKKDVSQFTAIGYKGDVDYDGYLIYFMDFYGSAFCANDSR